MKNHHTKEFRLMRSVVLWLYDFRCGFSNCKHKATDVHHIDKDSSNHNIINLVPLCSQHHRIAHISKMQFIHTKKHIIVLLLGKIVTFSK